MADTIKKGENAGGGGGPAMTNVYTEVGMVEETGDSQPDSHPGLKPVGNTYTKMVRSPPSSCRAWSPFSLVSLSLSISLHSASDGMRCPR